MEKLILVRKKKTRKVEGKKEQEFYQYTGRCIDNENKWISCNIVGDALAKLTLDKNIEFPVMVELNDGVDYFTTTYERINQFGEPKRLPKVVIKNYQSITHFELPSKTLSQVFDEME